MLVKNLVKKIVLTSLAACLVLASNAAWADTYYYNIMGDNNYADGLNWSAGLPMAGGTGYIEGYTTALSSDVSAFIPNELIVGDNIGSSVLNVNAGANLAVGSSGLYVGYTGNTGAIVQGGGTVAVSGNAYVGSDASSGSLTLNNGSLNIGYTMFVGYADVGWSGGTGTVVQNGGSSAFGSLWIGNGMAGSTSPGQGTFTQAGGTVTVSSELYLALDPGTTGAYSISNGSLSVAQLDVGQWGAGAFTVGGGTVTASGLFVGACSGSSGTVTVNGGSLDFSGSSSPAQVGLGSNGPATGAIIQTGGSLTFNHLWLGNNTSTGTFTQSGGTTTVGGEFYLALDPGSTGNYSISNGSLSVASTVSVGHWGTGNFTMGGGTVTTSGYFIVGYSSGSAGTVTLNGGSLSTSTTSGTLYVGYQPGSSGTIIVNGGTFNAGNAGGMQESVGDYGTGAIVQTGGLVIMPQAWVGNNTSTGTYTQSGGTATMGYCYLGLDPASTGAYSISNGSLSATTLDIAQWGKGTFTQTGGTVTTPNDFSIAVCSGTAGTSSGTMTINGGSFTGAQAIVGLAGNGALVQGGGTVTATNLLVGNNPGSSGTVTVNGGLFNAGSNAYVGVSGNGALVQGGSGTITVSNLIVGLNSGSAGTVTLNAGPLNIGSAGFVGYGSNGPATGALIQTGGALAIPQLWIGNNPNASAGTTTGTYTQSGGTETSTYFYLGLDPNSIGNYSISNGSMSATQIDVGQHGTGTITQSGGTVTTPNTLYIALYNGAAGSVTVSGGSLNVGGWLFVSYCGNGYALPGAFTQTGGTVTIPSGGIGITPSNLGSGTVTIGGGTLNLNGNIYSGGTTGTSTLNVTGGVVNMAGNVISGLTTFKFSGGTITDLGNISASAQAITLGAAGTTAFIQEDGGYNAGTVSGAISGLGNLTKIGTGTLYLGTTNTYSGSTTLSAGTLSIGSALALQDSTLNYSAGSVTFNGITTATFGGLSGSSNLAMTNIASGAVNLTVGSSGDNASTTYSGILSGGSLTKGGTGTLTLSGPNTYTGTTTVSTGILNIQNATALGTTGAGTSVSNGAALQIQGNITVGAETLALNGMGTASNGALDNVSGNNTYGGAITLKGNSRINSDDSGTLTLNSGTAFSGNYSLTVGGTGNTAISSAVGYSSGSLTKDGTGILYLTGSTNSSGHDVVSNGILDTGGTITLPKYNGGSLTVATGAAVGGYIGSSNWTVAQFTSLLSGATWSANAALAIDTTPGSNSYSSAISTAKGSTAVGLDKLGANTLTLSGGNTYTGTTTVLAGTLLLSGSTASISTSSDIQVAGGATYQVLVSTTTSVSLYSRLTAATAGALSLKGSIPLEDPGLTGQTVSMQWRARSAGETLTGPYLASDVLTLSGITTGTPYVLNMQYSPGQLNPSVPEQYTSVAYYTGGQWDYHAVDGNSVVGSSVTSAMQDYQGSWSAFATANYVTASNLSQFVGAWGVDTSSGKQAWAVLNYAGTFAVVPEPAALALLAIGLLGLVAYGRRKRK